MGKKNEGDEEEERTERRESSVARLVSALEDSVVSEADWQTRGRELGNVEGMWMKECIYRFVLGQLATWTEFSSSAEPLCLLAQELHSGTSLRIPKKKCDVACVDRVVVGGVRARVPTSYITRPLELLDQRHEIQRHLSNAARDTNVHN